jgi:hypothetical protein
MSMENEGFSKAEGSLSVRSRTLDGSRESDVSHHEALVKEEKLIKARLSETSKSANTGSLRRQFKVIKLQLYISTFFKDDKPTWPAMLVKFVLLATVSSTNAGQLLLRSTFLRPQEVAVRAMLSVNPVSKGNLSSGGLQETSTPVSRGQLAKPSNECIPHPVGFVHRR